MHRIFEITEDDIAKLNEDQFHDLIGWLCDADYKAAGLSIVDIRYGGKKKASDGGLDVNVDGSIEPPETSYVRRNKTGFQVKNENMTSSKIRDEMKPEGLLRPEIKALIINKGSYIIACNHHYTYKKGVDDRKKAMIETLKNETNYRDLHIDLLERNDIVKWVNNHTGIIIKVREIVCRPLSGWKGYGNWSNPRAGVGEEYIVDDKKSIHFQSKDSDIKTVIEGINDIRLELSKPKSSVRIVGLSGVGKTRFVQALFDGRIGEKALNKDEVCYAEMSNTVIPEPLDLIEQVIALKLKTVMILDNCPPDKHNKLTNEILNNDYVSLLTIEYDIRDDQTEETDVYKFETSSEQVIERILEKRYTNLSSNNRRTIAKFSGGNARLALSLATTVNPGDNLSGLKDNDLFERLFWQRHEKDDSLLKSGEVLSIVYSFEATDTQAKASELKFLASLVGKDVLELYGDMSKIEERGLIQTRGNMKAILPHAVANYLATKALKRIPKDFFLKSLFSRSSKRLLKSFSNRLQYLHNSKEAKEIVLEWLQPEGWLGRDLACLSSDEFYIFKNVAPVNPEMVLEAIDYNANKNTKSILSEGLSTHYQELIRILWHIAYEPNLFERCVKLLCRFLLFSQPNIFNGGSHRTVSSLFYIRMSGTKASPTQRANIITELANSNDKHEQILAISFLQAALKTKGFQTNTFFDFGSRPRDRGYVPKNMQEETDWFELFINICTDIAISDKDISEKARKVLAEELQFLWLIDDSIHNIIEKSALKIHETKSWTDGWIAVRRRLRIFNEQAKRRKNPESYNGYYNKIYGKAPTRKSLSRLRKLEQDLRPITDLDRARAFILSSEEANLDLLDNVDHDKYNEFISRIYTEIYGLGTKIALKTEEVESILPETVTETNTGNMKRFHFGRGLADGCEDIYEMWKILYYNIAKFSKDKRNTSVSIGFLRVVKEKNPGYYENLLDSLIEDDILGPYYPKLWSLEKVDPTMTQRLFKSLKSGKSLTDSFRGLAYVEIHDDDLAYLLDIIITKEGGLDVAIEIMEMRLFQNKRKASDFSQKYINVVHKVLMMDFFGIESSYSNIHSDRLVVLVRKFLIGDGGSKAAKKMCENILKASKISSFYSHNHLGLLKALVETQPIVFLDAFLGENNVQDDYQLHWLSSKSGDDISYLNWIPDNILLDWAEINPEFRYLRIATVILPYSKSKFTGQFKWLDIAHKILDKAPDTKLVLSKFAETLEPTSSYGGSFSAPYRFRLPLFEEMKKHPKEEVKNWASEQYNYFLKRIEAEKKRPDWRDSIKINSFENDNLY